MADDYEELAGRLISQYNPRGSFDTFRLVSDPQELTQDLEGSGFHIRRIGDKTEFERAKKIARDFQTEFNGQTVEVFSGNEKLFEDTLRVSRDRDDIEINFKKASSELRGGRNSGIRKVFREGSSVFRVSKQSDRPNFLDTMRRAEIRSLTVKKKTVPEPEPSPGIPEGEEPEDSQREMNPLVIYVIVGILAYVTAR
jgi:hypothetical protein